MLGALLFGYLTDRLGRKKLFLVTLATYSLATVATAFSLALFALRSFRFFTGVGIGGEYAAINSAVDELIPGKVRGTVDLIVNGTFWVGAIGRRGGGIFCCRRAWEPAEHRLALRLRHRRTLGVAVLLLRLCGAGESAVADAARQGGRGEADR